MSKKKGANQEQKALKLAGALSKGGCFFAGSYFAFRLLFLIEDAVDKFDVLVKNPIGIGKFLEYKGKQTSPTSNTIPVLLVGLFITVIFLYFQHPNFAFFTVVIMGVIIGMLVYLERNSK